MFHGAEIGFIFGSMEKILGYSREDADLAVLMQSYWTNFARMGNPNGQNLAYWPVYAGENWMLLSANTGVNSQVVRGLRKMQLDALEAGLLRKLAGLVTTQTSQPTGVGD